MKKKPQFVVLPLPTFNYHWGNDFCPVCCGEKIAYARSALRYPYRRVFQCLDCRITFVEPVYCQITPLPEGEGVTI